MADDFRTFAVSGPSFDALLASAHFEELGKGRRGTTLVAPDGDAIPLVRTTTRYRAPAQRFAAIHTALAQQLGTFNNALIEHYTPAYASMKQHSDQALDLADGSEIAIYSCYRDPSQPPRILRVTSKRDNTQRAIPLAPHTVVVFSLATNRQFTHAIAGNAEWLGVTFRMSKTFVRFVDGVPFIDGARLTLATEAQERELFGLKRRENAEPDFAYPPVGYTLSESDLVPPVGSDYARGP